MEKATPFRLRNASVRSENVEETEEETADEETPNGAAVPVAPNAEPRPRQASVAPSPNAPTYRESAVEAGVADKANVETAPNGSAKNFKYVSPFVTVNKKKSSASVAPSGRLGAVAR